ncbi:MAG: hypothetical protein GKR99_01020 [Rhodobacteraceae bacterium]|nr:hypothetical protein [Paracoccaceae bacterium]
MSDFLPKEVRDGLVAARKAALRKKSRLRLQVGDEIHTVLRYWDDGFSLEREGAPHLRGLVDLYYGAKHLMRCLIVASSEEEDEVTYEFKRSTEAVDSQPLDFERAVNAPTALLGR